MMPRFTRPSEDRFELPFQGIRIQVCTVRNPDMVWSEDLYFHESNRLSKLAQPDDTAELLAARLVRWFNETERDPTRRRTLISAEPLTKAPR